MSGRLFWKEREFGARGGRADEDGGGGGPEEGCADIVEVKPGRFTAAAVTLVGTAYGCAGAP